MIQAQIPLPGVPPSLCKSPVACQLIAVTSTADARGPALPAAASPQAVAQLQWVAAPAAAALAPCPASPARRWRGQLHPCQQQSPGTPAWQVSEVGGLLVWVQECTYIYSNSTLLSTRTNAHTAMHAARSGLLRNLTSKTNIKTTPEAWYLTSCFTTPSSGPLS
jgi:hypothetical protein